MIENPLEFPQSLCEVSEQNLDQAHIVYDQLTNFVAKAIDAWIEALPSNPLSAGFKAVNARAMQFAKDNGDGAFAFSSHFRNAQTLSEILALQTRFAQDQMQAFVEQAQELSSLIEDALQKAGDGTYYHLDPIATHFKVSGFKAAQDGARASQ